MSQSWRTFGAAIAIGVLVASACTVKKFPDQNVDANGGTDQGGANAGGGKGGSTGGGGRVSHAGTSNKGGGSGSASGGRSGAAGEGGSGDAAGTTQAASGSGGTDINAGGQGGSAGAVEPCAGCASGACLPDGTCVACTPANDRCASGQYCTDANTCAPGCKPDGSSCASGLCGQDHNCKNCIGDAECLPGLFCGGGLCGEPCKAEQENQELGCDVGLTCCSLHCADLATDSHHCGACGTSCGDTEFCGAVACATAGEGGAGAGGASGTSSAPCVTCQATALANMCAVSKVIVILDTTKNPNDGNRKPGRAIGAALAASCPLQPVLTEAEQDSVAALNLTTGRPVSDSGELLVVAGGPFYQSVEGYLEDQKIAPLHWHVSPDSSEYRKTSNDADVVGVGLTADHDSHDFFIVQFMRDPASSSLILNAQGLWLSGTVAATYELTNVVLPQLSTFDKAWYAFEWTDMDGDMAPDANEIELKASGD